MQLNAVLVALAAACGPCRCRAAKREQWGAPPASLLAQPATATPAPQVPVATLGSGDPARTEALANPPPDPGPPVPEDAAEVEMASTSEALVNMAIANITEFEEYVVEKLMLICMAPPSQFIVRLQSDLGSAATTTTEDQVFKEVPTHPTLALAQRGRRMLRRASRQAATQTAKINITALMWVVFIKPPNITVANETNATNVTNQTNCPPCPCAPTGPPPLFPGLSANETAALAGRSAAQIADDLVDQATGGDTPLHGLLPLTTVRRHGRNFPAIAKNSVTIGSHAQSTGSAAESDTGRSVEATEINEGTQELVKELRDRLQAANEARAAVLTGDQVPAPSLDGFTVPVASGSDSPWANLDFEPEPERRQPGHRSLLALRRR